MPAHGTQRPCTQASAGLGQLWLQLPFGIPNPSYAAEVDAEMEFGVQGVY